MRIIGDQIWFEGYHVADLRVDFPSTIRGEVECWLTISHEGEIESLELQITELLEQAELDQEKIDGLTKQVADLKSSLETVKAELEKWE